MQKEPKGTRINFIHLCEYFSLSENNKANILGIFNERYIPKESTFPLKFSQFYLVVNMRFETSGSHKAVLSLKNLDDNQIIYESPTEFATSNENELVGSIEDFSFLEFEKAGNYEFRVTLEDKITDSVVLKVVKED